MTELKISKGMSMDSWKSFQALWRLYRKDADLSKAERSLQLMYCCSEELRNQLFRADPTVTAKSEGEQLKSIREIAVVPRTMEGGCSKLHRTAQKVEERPQNLLEK